MTKHTQGPWKDYGHEGQINGADNSYICQVESKNTKADIALIAAAPDLLDALKNLKGWFDYAKEYGADAYPINESYLAQATAAIAKAEGR